jgi:phosphoribosyl-ATP pyrophosphohydrolase
MNPPSANRPATNSAPTPESSSVLQRLFLVIEDRRANPPEKSYTTSLFAGGVAKIASKISEEAAEVNEAALEDGDAGRQHLVEEAADLVYHLLVMLAHRDASFEDVEKVLAGRFGVSGIDEKESRAK